MIFWKFIKKQISRKDAVGDLARDMVAPDTYDRHKVPKGAAYKHSWLRYLDNCGASDAAIKAFNKAWSECERAE